MTLTDVTCYVRLNNYIKKAGANSNQIESFTANIAKSQEPQILFELD